MKITIYLSLFLLLPVYLCAENLSLDQCINNYKRVFADLEKCRDEIRIDTRTEHFVNTITTYFYYCCRSHFAEEAVKKHRDAYSALQESMYVNAYIDGVVLGVFCAGINTILKREIFDKKSLGAMVIVALCRIGYQNHRVGKIPYFDSLRLQKYSDLFAGLSLHTIGRLAIVLLGQTVSYLGTSYLIYRLSN